MSVLGYIASVLIGISLGLIGGGGSILTVPVLVYLFSVDAVLATAYSLFIVGTTSFVGSISYFRKDLVHIRTVILFGIPSIIAVFLVRRFLIVAIPDELFRIGRFIFTKNILLMAAFAILMVLAAFSMIRKNYPEQSQMHAHGYGTLWLQGILVGGITGLVGAGGGFLIIPVLVNILKLPMKTAVGTSLVIIALNSLLGFLFSLKSLTVQWNLIFTISIIAVAGILIGSYLSDGIEGRKLKPAFGWFILAMGIFILIKEILFR